MGQAVDPANTLPTFWIPTTFSLVSDDDLMEVGAGQSSSWTPSDLLLDADIRESSVDVLPPVGVEGQEAGRDKPVRPPFKSEYRWSCMECGAFVGQLGADHLHAASCSRQSSQVVKVRVYENGLIDYPAMTIPTQFLIESE
jgi:hypothetical protein